MHTYTHTQIKTERQNKILSDKDIEYVVVVAVVMMLLLILLLLSLRYNPASPEICVPLPETSPLFMQRLTIAEPRNFSDISSYLLLFLLFFLVVSDFNLAIAIAIDIRKSLVALGSAKHVR